VYVYQLIGRAHSAEDAKHICDLFAHSLSLVQSPGYARGFCAINSEDKVSVLIQEEWYNLGGFQFWQQSEEYRRLRNTIEPLLEGVWEPQTYRGQS